MGDLVTFCQHDSHFFPRTEIDEEIMIYCILSLFILSLGFDSSRWMEMGRMLRQCGVRDLVFPDICGCTGQCPDISGWKTRRYTLPGQSSQQRSGKTGTESNDYLWQFQATFLTFALLLCLPEHSAGTSEIFDFFEILVNADPLSLWEQVIFVTEWISGTYQISICD